MNLSIENVPEDVVERLRQRAARNHRSLQGELSAIVEAAAGAEGRVNVREVYAEIKTLGLNGPDESTAIIRADRDREEGR